MSEETPKSIKKSISEATAAELREFAKISLGLDGISDTDGIPAVIGKMAAAGYNLPTITIQNPDLVVTPRDEDSPSGARREVNGRTEIRIQIHKSEKAGGSRDVPVGVNGKMFMIPRGKPVWVPEAYVEALKNAVELHYPPYDESTDRFGGLKEPEMVQSYAFSYA